MMKTSELMDLLRCDMKENGDREVVILYPDGTETNDFDVVQYTKLVKNKHDVNRFYFNPEYLYMFPMVHAERVEENEIELQEDVAEPWQYE